MMMRAIQPASTRFLGKLLLEKKIRPKWGFVFFSLSVFIVSSSSITFFDEFLNVWNIDEEQEP